MTIKFREISIDTAHIPGLPSRLEQTFFDVNPCIDGATRVTDLDEKLLVRWIMIQEPARRLLFEAIGFSPSAFYQPQVVEPFYCANTGDIDLVICNRYAPNQAVAIECKRVKVTVLDPERHQLNKVEELRVGVGQANRLYDNFGFAETYLAVLTAVEASAQEGTNIPCRGIDAFATPDYGGTKTLERIIDFPGRNLLHQEVGIVFFEIVQPSRISIDKRVNLLVYVHHPAFRRSQQDSVTNRMEILLAAS